MLAGREKPDTGAVMLRNGISVGFLDQEPDISGNITIQDFLTRGHSDAVKAIRQYESAIKRLETDHSDAAQNEFEKASAAMDRFQAWDYEQRLTSILGKLDIHDLEKPVSVLSGGEKKRVALAFVLLEESDLLILDEPTNHLDVDMIEWLEKYLSRSTTTLFMVTHDRYFLDRVCNQILEMDDGKLYLHRGDYANYLEKKAEREEIEGVDHWKSIQLYKKELAWMRRGPKARTTKSKSRIESFYEVEARVQGKKEEAELKLDVKMSRLGSHMVDFEHTSKAFGEKIILQDFSYAFQPGERVGIIGNNGTGKTTFLKMLTGELQPDSGKVIIGETLVFGHFKQQGVEARPGKRVIELVKEVAEVIPLANGKTLSASQFLEHFLFSADLQWSPIEKLSGGERRRLGLMMTLLKNPNFLILDEPTNDLDLETMNRLEEFLLNYPGCLILVTHDRFILDKLVDHLFIFHGNGRITDYGGSYSGWRLELESGDFEAEVKTDTVKKPASVEKPAEKKKNPASAKELAALERDIQRLESEKADLEKKLVSVTVPSEINTLSNRYATIEAQLEEKMTRWLDLGG